MRKAVPALLCIAVLAGCSDNALPYRDPIDRAGAAIGLFASLCRRRVTNNGQTSYEFIGYDRCYRFDPPSRMRGVWLARYEDTQFFPNAAAVPAKRDMPAESTWLEIDEDMLSLADREIISGHGHAVAIDFVGRRATYPGRYGHGGLSRNLVLVDKLLSLRAIDPPRRPDTESLSMEGPNRR